MKKRKTFTVMAMVIAMLVLAVGYAITSNDLVLNGNANVLADADFNVVFTGESTKTTGQINVDGDDTDVVTVTKSGDYESSMVVYLGDDVRTAYACLEIENSSEDLGAKLAATATNISADNDYFKEVEFGLYSDSNCSKAITADTVISAKGKAYLKATVGLKSLPVDEMKSASFNITVKPTPVEADV